MISFPSFQLPPYITINTLIVYTAVWFGCHFSCSVCVSLRRDVARSNRVQKHTEKYLYKHITLIQMYSPNTIASAVTRCANERTIAYIHNSHIFIMCIYMWFILKNMCVVTSSNENITQHSRTVCMIIRFVLSGALSWAPSTHPPPPTVLPFHL